MPRDREGDKQHLTKHDDAVSVRETARSQSFMYSIIWAALPHLVDTGEEFVLLFVRCTSPYPVYKMTNGGVNGNNVLCNNVRHRWHLREL